MSRVLRFALVGCGILTGGAAMAPAPWTNPEPMTVVMVDNRFEPDHLTFQVDRAYELRLVNKGKDMHEFTAPDFLKSATIRDPKLLSNGGTDIVVQSGHSLNVLLIPRKKGDFGLTCADHDWDGMVGDIKVQ